MNPDPRAIKSFMDHHFRHFNAATVVEAARGWADLLKAGDAMMVTLAGGCPCPPENS